MGQSSGGGRSGGLGVAPAVAAKLKPAAEKYGFSVLGSAAAKAVGASNGGTSNPPSKTSKLR